MNMRLTAFIVSVFCVLNVCGQKYTPHIIITKAGERIEGLAAFKNDYIMYKTNPNDKKPIKLNSSEVRYAAEIEGDTITLFSGLPVYHVLSDATTPSNVGWIRFLSDPEREPVSTYMYRYVSGKSIITVLGCYRQGDEYGQDLFSSAVFAKSSKEAMMKYFADCPSLVEYINNMRLIKMTIDDFINLVTEYNQCVK